MAGEAFQTARGTRDVLWPDSWQMEQMRELTLSWARRYGYELIETPILEKSGVFLRLGEATDIVQHERYRFVDCSGDDLTLRPEGTAAVARAFLQHGLGDREEPVRLCYFGPMFRRERPEAGRFRQHTQFGAELYGSHSPLADAEVILLALSVVDAAGLTQPEARINSIGCADCRPQYRQALIEYFSEREAQLCDDCQARLHQNPLRLLDCKVDVAIRESAPDVESFWCNACRDHIHAVMALIEEAGRRVVRDRHLVRGLDYYTRTVFEVGHPRLGSQVALFGGGRYDGLTASLNGPAVPAVGFGMGIERLLSALPQPMTRPVTLRIYVAHLPGAERDGYRLAQRLRAEGLETDTDLLDRSLKAQLKDAGRRARLAVIVGGREWEQGAVVVRDLSRGEQATVGTHELLSYLRTKIQEDRG
ncbi:MAG: histidine--tRNA ligase [Firmicutes bacterium]|nr:histidine--tRNA ligase [Bacillota bacterium]